MLEAMGLVKRYGGRAALAGFDLEVRAGEIVGLVGHNGAGKTTFVEVVTGLVRPDAGRVRVGGVDGEQMNVPGMPVAQGSSAGRGANTRTPLRPGHPTCTIGRPIPTPVAVL
jgi:ABC-type branched-subunit amino acid transport system ATPase component